MNRSIGAMEFRSISKGIEISDLMVKRADIEIIYFKTICPGKFLIIISGNEGEVKESIDYGAEMAGRFMVDKFILNAVHNEIISGLKNKYSSHTKGAFGVIETINVCSGIEALDIILKNANVTVVKMQVAFLIGGKFVSIVSGEVSDIENGVKIAQKMINYRKFVNISIIPSPDIMIVDMLT
ncbi:MAG: BMC domain-containing protein [Clostridium sp.]